MAGHGQGRVVVLSVSHEWPGRDRGEVMPFLVGHEVRSGGGEGREENFVFDDFG